jgi:hypothetical protein
LSLLVPLAGLALASRCGGGGGSGPVVVCENREPGFEFMTSIRGRDAIHRCLTHPGTATPGHSRRVRARAGKFIIPDDELFDLTAGWTLEGAGVDETFIYASDSNGVFTNLESFIWVHGRDVRLADFTLDGDCASGLANPPPSCDVQTADVPTTTLGIVVSCGVGLSPPPDCDVDGLVVENVRVQNFKDAFVATRAVSLWSNFQDLTWTIRNFQVPTPVARVFQLGGPTAGAEGIGEGAMPPPGETYEYVINIESSVIETQIGWPNTFIPNDSILDVLVDDNDVDVTINLVDSTLVGSQRVVFANAQNLDDAESRDGRLTLNCVNSALVADRALWSDPTGCPPFDAAIYLAQQEIALPGLQHLQANFTNCSIEVKGTPTCPALTSLDTGLLDGQHTGVCLDVATTQNLSPANIEGNAFVELSAASCP